jgi:hypothetical protein
MSTQSSRVAGRLLVLAAGVCTVFAQGPLEPGGSFHISFPKDSPVTLVSADMGQSRADARGGAMMLDLHTVLTLRNSGRQNIRGVSLLVLAQEVTPGGKASVTVPSLFVPAGEVFPVRIDLRLLRPLAAGTGPLVQVALDGVLFDDLTFYGPNKLNSRRAMTQWELEARRDRKYLQAALESNGEEGLRKTILASLARQGVRPRVDAQVARNGRSTNVEPEREAAFAFLHFPNAPVEPLSGAARISGNEARYPKIEVRNRTDREIRYLEMGWLVRDRDGREFMAGSVPAEVTIGPGQKASITQSTAMTFTERQRPVPVEGMTGYVASVEFADGKVWIPTRNDLTDERLQRTLMPSPEEQRLTDLYRKKGLAAVLEELKRR